MKKNLWFFPVLITVLLFMITLSCRKKDTGNDLTTQKIIGQSYGGGIIFFVDASGQHGLIAATTDQSSGADWGCMLTSIAGTSEATGTGLANTTLIENGCGTAGTAARICFDLVLNGFSDWYLPSKDELNLLYTQRNVIGGLVSGSYWSSSQFFDTLAWLQYFANGNQSGLSKNVSCSVRAIRAF